jgi:hypothetical protein
MNINEVTNETGQRYVRTWITAFNVFLSWQEETTLRWVDKWSKRINNPDDWLFHEPPIYYVVVSLVSDELKKRLPSYELQDLYRRMVTEIQNGDSFFDTKPDFNWKEARLKVEVLLAKYGEKLPID